MAAARLTGRLLLSLWRPLGLQGVGGVALGLATLLAVGGPAWGLADLIRGLDHAPAVALAAVGAYAAWRLAHRTPPQRLLLLGGALLVLLASAAADSPLSPARFLDRWLLSLGGGDWLRWPAALWSAALWLGGAWAGERIVRGDALGALLPLLALYLLPLSYAGGGLWPLMVGVGGLLLTMGLATFDHRSRAWLAVAVRPSDYLAHDLVFVLLPLTLALLLVSLAAPSLTVGPLTRRLQPALVEQMAPLERLVSRSGVRRPGSAGLSLSALADPGLPTRQLIGAGPELSQIPVMEVEWFGPDAVPGGEPIPLYWRGATYDLYDGRGWGTSETRWARIEAGESLPTMDSGREIGVRVRQTRQSRSLLFAPGALTTASEPLRVARREDGTQFAATVESPRYEVMSRLPEAGPDRLRSAPPTRDGTLLDSYLALPDTLPLRVGRLAAEVTAGRTNPYDQARALERYLRQFPYTLDLPAPPAGREISDYFLFDLQRGYCDYYATSMVVMARTLGIPARLATGYVTGEPLSSRRFRVTEAEAHAWPELYFSGIGWLPFEPTGGRPARDEAVALSAGGAAPFRPTVLSPGTLVAAGRGWLPLLALAAVCLWGVRWFRARKRWAAMGEGARITFLFERMVAAAAPLRLPAEPGTTPIEWAALLALVLRPSDLGGRWQQWLGGGAVEARHLAAIYTRTTYRAIAGEGDLRAAAGHWSRLALRLRVAGWLARLERLRARPTRPRDRRLAERDQIPVDRPVDRVQGVEIIREAQPAESDPLHDGGQPG